jgi:hypothetical protein
VADTEVALALQWSEAGAQIPADAQGKLERLGGALQRLEAREPTMALRQTRFAIASLAAEAVGATGPLAKLGEVALLLGAGTTTGLVIMGGIAAVAAGYKAITSEAREAAAETKKLHEEVARLAELSPEGKQAAHARLAGQTFQELAQVQQVQIPQLRTHYEELRRMFGEHAKSTQQAAANLQAAVAHAEKLRALFIDMGAAGQLAPVEVTAGQMGILNEAERLRRMRSPIHRMGGLTLESGQLFGGGEDLFPGGPMGLRAGGFLQRAIMRREHLQFRETGEEKGREEPDKTDAIAARILGHGVAFAGAIASRSPGGALAALGGAVGTVPGGQLVGAGLAGLGGLASIFGQPKPLTIGAFTEFALSQMRDLRPDPLTTSIALIGTDPRSMAYNLARLGRRDAAPRFP